MTALVTLFTGTLVGASGLVLCLGSDGHRAIEFEHSGRECPSLASSESATGASVQAPSGCFDLAATGMGPIAPSSFDPERLPMPAVAFLAAKLEVSPRIEAQLPAPNHTRAGPSVLALQLRSTVLLV